MSGPRGQRGQTEGVGVVLLTAVVVLGIGTFGTFYLGAIADHSSATVAADLDVVAVNESGTTTLTVTHTGGEPIEDGAVVVQSSGATDALSDPFEEGMQWSTTLSGAPAGSQLRVLVVENATDAVVFNSRVTVQAV